MVLRPANLNNLIRDLNYLNSRAPETNLTNFKYRIKLFKFPSLKTNLNNSNHLILPYVLYTYRKTGSNIVHKGPSLIYIYIYLNIYIYIWSGVWRVRPPPPPPHGMVR